MDRASYCKDCNEQIIFIRTERGKNMPCNPNMVPYKEDPCGQSQILTKSGKIIRCELGIPIEQCTAFGYIPHWKTCKARAGQSEERKGK